VRSWIKSQTKKKCTDLKKDKKVIVGAKITDQCYGKGSQKLEKANLVVRVYAK